MSNEWEVQKIRESILDADRFGRNADIEHQVSYQACLEVINGIFALTDFGFAASTSELYSKSIVMDLDGAQLNRADRVQRSLARQENKNRRTRHVISNFLFKLIDSRTAYGLSIVTIYHEDDRSRQGVSPLAVADCTDVFRFEEDGRWRVIYRNLSTVAGAAH